MSHIPQRKEKDCLNCGTIVQGRFCHVCGQENVVPKETFWHMVTHFFYDITHFDSSFFHTVHHLFFKPGFLSKEYMLGRRARYLHPIRLYVFSSAFFFLLFFTFFSAKNAIKTNIDDPVSIKERTDYIQKLEGKLKEDSANEKLSAELQKVKDTSQVILNKDMMTFNDNFSFINISDKHYKTKAEYDSLQQLLAVKNRDGWFKKRLVYTQINLDNKFRENPDEFANKLIESILHRLPYMLFVSLPLFALILKLVYIRRKKFIFADHGVFTIHLYVFTFLLLIIIFGLDKLQDIVHWGILDFINAILFIGIFIYLYKAMRKFYEQGGLKTFIKFLLVSFCSFILMMILFVLFSIFSVITI